MNALRSATDSTTSSDISTSSKAALASIRANVRRHADELLADLWRVRLGVGLSGYDDLFITLYER